MSECLDQFWFVHTNFCQFCLSLIRQTFFLTKQKKEHLLYLVNICWERRLQEQTLLQTKVRTYHYTRQIFFYKWKHSGQIHKNRLCLFIIKIMHSSLMQLMFLRKGKNVPTYDIYCWWITLSFLRDQAEGGQKVFAFCCIAQGGKSEMKNSR